MLRIDWQALVSYVRMDLAAIDRIGVATRVAITVARWARVAGAIEPGKEVIGIAASSPGARGASARSCETEAGRALRCAVVCADCEQRKRRIASLISASIEQLEALATRTRLSQRSPRQ